MQHRTGVMVIGLALSLGTQSATADVDLGGRWVVTSSFGSLCLDIGQTGTVLNAIDCGGGVPYSGSIDPMTGAFTLAQPPGCNTTSITATATPDSNGFVGAVEFSIFHCTFIGCSCLDFDDAVVGTRSVCGDGITLSLAGEQCDDGNTAGDDCCSPTCLRAPFGSPCSDGNPCTTEACGVSGLCNGTPVPDHTACNDGDACTDADHCLDGVCAGADLCGDAMTCYRAADRGQPGFDQTNVALADEYSSDPATVLKPQAVCNPASLGGVAIVDPATHLTCYKIAAPPLASPERIESESRLGAVQLQLSKPKLLCLPSSKTVLP